MRYIRPVFGTILLITGTILFVLPVPVGIFFVAVGIIMMSPDIPLFRQWLRKMEGWNPRSRFIVRRIKKMMGVEY